MIDKKKLLKGKKGITLVALVITIIMLLILAGVTLNLTIGENGLLDKSEQSVSEHDRQEASEKMTLKLTNLQIKNYAEKQKLPTLQEIADGLCEDEEMQYVLLESQKTASLKKIDVNTSNSIFAKLKAYPYEFEINSKLQLASIDGIKISNNDEKVEISKTEYEELKSKVESLTNKSAITARSSKEYSVNANSAKVDLDAIVQRKGSGLSIENGGVKIGSGITSVLVSGGCYVEASDQKAYSLRIFLNDSVIYWDSVRASGNTAGAVTATYLLNVKEGDIIYLYCDNTSGGGTIKNNLLTVIQY